MKKHIVIILIISLAMIISCTGCENEIEGTIDLTDNDQILTSYLWVKELDGEGDTYLAFKVAAMSEMENRYTMNIYEQEDAPESMMGLINRKVDGSLTALFGDSEYVVKISSSQSELITLSLTKVGQEQTILYFTPVDLI